MTRTVFHRTLAALTALGVLLMAATVLAQEGKQEVLSLTLADAVQRAVENNPDLAIVRLGTEVEAARVGESKSAFSPVFSTMFGRSSNVTPPSNFLLGDRGVDVNDVFSSTGIRQRLPWGAGTWSLSWDTSRTTSNSPLNSFDPALQSGFQVAFSQPLFKDRKIDSARQQYIIAKRNQESSELRFRESAVQTVAARQAGVLDAQGDGRQRRRSAALTRAGAGARAAEQDPRRCGADSAVGSGAGRSRSRAAAREPDSRQRHGRRRRGQPAASDHEPERCVVLAGASRSD